MLLLFLASLLLLEGPGSRLGALTLLVAVLLRAPGGEAFGLRSLFSPATFFRPLLGPFSASAGILALTSAGCWRSRGVLLWRRRLPRRWYRVVLGVLILAAAPYAMRELGRGITPPACGCPARALAGLADHAAAGDRGADRGCGGALPG